MKLLIISICKNEAATIGKLLDQIPKQDKRVTQVQTVVIDDGSTDNTAAVAKKHGALVYRDGASKGLAFRFREALDIALELDADILVNIDGDLQFSPKDIPKLVRPILEGNADFVAADRFTSDKDGSVRRPKNMPLGKYIGNKLGARVLSKLARQNFRDVTCGFRAYNRNALLALNLNSTHTYTQESFQILAIKRLRIVTLPVHVTYFKGRKSRVVRSIFSYTAISALNIMRAYRDFAPLRFFLMLGAGPMILGTLACLAAGAHWIATGMITPYKFVGIGGIGLLALGIFWWSLGILADMFVRVNGTQERTYEAVKRHYTRSKKQ
jgi:glycosyltransferase involved in cell wall biosynthesis